MVRELDLGLVLVHFGLAAQKLEVALLDVLDQGLLFVCSECVILHQQIIVRRFRNIALFKDLFH